MKVALIKQGVVATVALFESIETAKDFPGYDEAVALKGDEAEPGYHYEGGAFIAPKEQTEHTKTWSESEIKLAFTREERIVIREAAKTDAGIDDFWDMLNAKTQSGSRIHADDTDFLAGIDHLVSAGYLTDERKHEILD